MGTPKKPPFERDRVIFTWTLCPCDEDTCKRLPVEVTGLRRAMVPSGVKRIGGLVVAMVLVVGAGCAGAGLVPGTLAARDGQEQAVWSIWHDSYHREDVPPKVRWVEGSQLSCSDPNSGRPGFEMAGLACREGRTLDPFEVFVAWRPDDRFDTTTLAHELWHVVLARQLIIDSDHKTPGFQPLASCGAGAAPECGVVEKANLLLQARGL